MLVRFKIPIKDFEKFKKGEEVLGCTLGAIGTMDMKVNVDEVEIRRAEDTGEESTFFKPRVKRTDLIYVKRIKKET